MKRKLLLFGGIFLILILVVSPLMAGCAKITSIPAKPISAPAPDEAPASDQTPASQKVEVIDSIDFTLTGSTYEGWKGEIRYRARGIQSGNSDFRIEETTGDLRKLIANNTAGEFYSYENGVWTKYTGPTYMYFTTMSMPFAVMFGSFYPMIEINGAADFTEGTISVTKITINSTLGDELFSPPSGTTIKEASGF